MDINAGTHFTGEKMLDPVALAAAVIQQKIPRLTLDEAAHVAWEVIATLKQADAINAANEPKKEPTP